MKTSNKDWEKEFEEFIDNTKCIEWKDIKQFIKDLLLQHNKEIIEKVKKGINKYSFPIAEVNLEQFCKKKISKGAKVISCADILFILEETGEAEQRKRI
jgi:hypothetical protein